MNPLLKIVYHDGIWFVAKKIWIEGKDLLYYRDDENLQKVPLHMIFSIEPLDHSKKDYNPQLQAA